MFVKTSAQEEAPLLVFPLVLEEEAAYAHALFEVSVVAEYDVFQRVVVVFCAEGEVGGHEQQFVEVMHILCSHHISEVVGGAISLHRCLFLLVGAFAYAAVVALATGGLEGEVGGEAVFVVGCEIVEGQSATLYVVFHLLGDVCLVRCQLELVAATTKLIYAVILQAELGVWAETEVGV